jgi:hypothetical protein
MLQYTIQRAVEQREDQPSQLQPLHNQYPPPQHGLSQLSQLSQNSITHAPMQSLFWNTPNPAVLSQRLAQVSNMMLSQGSHVPTQQLGFDFIGGHL